MSMYTVLVILMIFLGHCRDLHYVNTYQTTAYYQCFKQQGYNQVGTYLQPYFPETVSQCIQNMLNIKNAGLGLEVMLVVCRRFTPEEQVQIIVQNMGLTAIDRFWVYPDFF